MQGTPSPAGPAPATPAAADELFCPGCSYDLRGSIGSDRCPECGLAIDREQLGVSRIPWSHRRKIGGVRAYWRTVVLATFQTRRLGAEVTRPVDYGDAQRFRLVTSLIASLTVLAVVGVGVVTSDEKLFAGSDETAAEFLGSWSTTTLPPGALDLAFPFAAGVLIPPVVPIAFLLFVLLATGVGSYWFHPRSQPVVRQNRAVALSHYACAPLAFMPLPAVGLFVLVVVTENLSIPNRAMNRLMIFTALLVYVLVPLIGLAFYATTLRLLRVAAGAGTGRMWLAAVVIPATWLLCAAVTLFALPWVVGFVVLVVDSLR